MGTVRLLESRLDLCLVPAGGHMSHCAAGVAFASSKTLLASVVQLDTTLLADNLWSLKTNTSSFERNHHIGKREELLKLAGIDHDGFFAGEYNRFTDEFNGCDHK